MAGPLGALPVGLVVSTTEFEEDIDGGPPRKHCGQVRQRSPLSFEDDVDGGPAGGYYRRVRQHPPPSLKMTSMAGPLGGAVDGSGSIHHRV
jgi:hypothetical protein